MTQDQQNRPLSELSQAYDSSLKEWIFQQAPAILPLLLPGAIYEQTLTIEQIRPTVRMDKVFRIRYHEEEHILHLEFETGYDKELRSRLLVYNAGLYRDHRLPVISIVVYPFSVTMAVSPLCIKSGKDEILTFRFKTLPLFELDAEDFVRQHHTAMYPLLPTMKNVHAELVAQVMQELVELYQDDEVTLAQQLIWMELLLERTGTVSPLEKEKIEERLSMFDQLWEESPRVQRMREAMREQYRMQGLQEGRREGLQEGRQEGRQEGLQEGLQEGRQEGLQEGRQEGLQEGLQALQRSLVSVVRARYPDLAELAQQQVSHFDKPDTLELLIQKLLTAPNADTIRWLLESGTE